MISCIITKLRVNIKALKIAINVPNINYKFLTFFHILLIICSYIFINN